MKDWKYSGLNGKMMLKATHRRYLRNESHSLTKNRYRRGQDYFKVTEESNIVY